jgi:putative FmdB family regulatory protein
MPIYEYECEKCGHQTEVLQKFSDPPIAKCDACSGRMKKVISQSTFHLKGTGWYVTDYASKSGSSNAKSHSGESRSESSGSAEKSTKLETKGSSENSTKKETAKGSD